MNAVAHAAQDDAILRIAKSVADLWCEVLGIPGPIQSTDTFFELGGDSLTMLLFLFRANELFGVDLPPAVMLDAPELQSVCSAFARAVSAASSAPSGAIPGHSSFQ
jgi:hypothetical protein